MMVWMRESGNRNSEPESRKPQTILNEDRNNLLEQCSVNNYGTNYFIILYSASATCFELHFFRGDKLLTNLQKVDPLS